MRRLARATATGLAILSAPATLAALAAPASAADTHRAAAHASQAPRRVAGTVTVVGYLRLQKAAAKGAGTQAFLFCESVEAASGPATVAGFGNVTDPSAACRELGAVGGDVTRMLVHPTWMVPALEAPVTVTVSGTWTARQVSYQHTYRNTGELSRNLGDVVGF